MKQKTGLPYLALAVLSCGLVCFACLRPAARAGMESAAPLPLWLTAVLAVIACALSAWTFRSQEKKKPPERVFCAAAAVCVLLMCAVLPLGTVPDEGAHIEAAQRLVRGQPWTGSAALPANLLDGVNSSATLQGQAREGFFADPFGDPAPVPPNEGTGLYPALSYLPQAFGMAAAGALTGLRAPVFYAARLFNMLLFIGMGFWAIRLMPFGKNLLFAVLLMPLSLQEAASFSVDGAAIAGAALLTAVILRGCSGKGPMPRGERVLLGLLCCCTVLWKVLYVPLVLGLFAIPAERWGSRRQKAAWLSGIFAAILLAIGAWAVLSVWSQTAQEGLTSDAFQRLGRLLTDPLDFWKLLFQTVQRLLLPMLGSLFNGFGALDIHPGRALQLSGAAMFAALCLSDVHLPKQRPVSTRVRALMIGIGVLVSLLISLSLYLWWTPEDYPVIRGIQARYFLPLFPMLLVCLPDLRFARKYPRLISFLTALAPVHAVMMAANILTVSLG